MQLVRKPLGSQDLAHVGADIGISDIAAQRSQPQDAHSVLPSFEAGEFLLTCFRIGTFV